METIKQKDYPQLEIDCREQDIIQVWMNGKDDSNVIQIEKSNLQALIDLLKREADSFKNLHKAHINGNEVALPSVAQLREIGKDRPDTFLTGALYIIDLIERGNDR